MARRASSVVIAVALALTACSTGDGTTLRPPTEPAPAVDDDPDEAGGASGGDTVIEPADDPSEAISSIFELFPPWSVGGQLPERFTCDGAGVAPPLAWSPPPTATVELVLVMTQLTDTGDGFDDIGIVHWLVAGIAPTLTSSPEGGLAPGAVALANAFGENGWTPPCPPEGTTGVYTFTLHALDEPLGDVSALPLDAVVDQIRFTSTVAAIADVTLSR